MCTSALLASCTASTSTDLEQRVDELYDRMSQEERIAQLRSMYMDELFDDDGQLDTAKCRELIPNGIGHFSQFCMQKPRDPVQLQGFARVSLQPGETKTVSVKLYVEQFGFYQNDGGQRSWNVLPGNYIIKVGASSVDFRLQQQITLTGKPVSKPLRENYFSEVTVL